MNTLFESSTPLVITAALQGLDLRSVVSHTSRVSLPEARLPRPRPGTDDPAPKAEEQIAVSADGNLVPKQLYPSGAASEANVRYYVPDYAPRLEQGRHTSSLRFRAASDDPAGPLGWLTLELMADRPQDPAFELKEIEHDVQLRLGHRLPVEGMAAGEGGAMLWIPLGPLDRSRDGVGVCRHPFHSREEFDDLFGILTDASRNAVLQIEYRATIGQRSWNQILVGTLRKPELLFAAGAKRIQLSAAHLRPMGGRSAASFVGAGAVQPTASMLLTRPPIATLNPAAIRPFPVRSLESLADGCTAFEQVVAASAIDGFRGMLDHPSLNDRPGALVFVTPVWQQPGPYHPHPIGVRFLRRRWTIENLDQRPFPPNSRFSVLVVEDAGQLATKSGGRFKAYAHSHSASPRSESGAGNHISALGGSRDQASALFVTQGVGEAVNKHTVGTWFSPADGCQTVYNEDRRPLRVGSRFHVLELKSDGFWGLHLHVANASNTRGHVTTIDHPLTNGNRRAVVLVCHDYGPSGPYVPHPVGVWFDGSRWTIFTQDQRPMPGGARFRVLILARTASSESNRDPAEALVDADGEPILVSRAVSATRDLQPFTFPLESHGYMFDVPTDPVKNRVFLRNSIRLPNGDGVTFYQDSLFRDQVFYEPLEFRLTRYSTDPYGPSIVFAFSPVMGESTDGDPSTPGADNGARFDVRLAYRAIPFLPPQVLLEARRLFGPETAFSALIPATSTLTLQLPDADGNATVELEREEATISFEDGIIDELSLPQAQFERIFARFLEPGGVGVRGTLRATLTDGTAAAIPVELSLRESAGDVFERRFKGPVDGAPGTYVIELRNRIESPVRIRELYGVAIRQGVTALPDQPPPARAVHPGETIEIQYHVSPDSEPVLDLEPSMDVEIDLDLPRVHQNITLNQVPSEQTRAVRVSIDPIFFELPPPGKPALVSVTVAFDSGIEVRLTPELPSATAELVVPLLVRLMLREGEQKDFSYGYTVTLTFADDTREETGPFSGIGNLEITPGER